MQTHIQVSSFRTDDTWSILSEIELSIKRKVEDAGVPLKDWDVEMYRGVLTGYNDAFIITSEKREEILSHCANDAESLENLLFTEIPHEHSQSGLVQVRELNLLFECSQILL